MRNLYLSNGLYVIVFIPIFILFIILRILDADVNRSICLSVVLLYRWKGSNKSHCMLNQLPSSKVRLIPLNNIFIRKLLTSLTRLCPPSLEVISIPCGRLRKSDDISCLICLTPGIHTRLPCDVDLSFLFWFCHVNMLYFVQSKSIYHL